MPEQTPNLMPPLNTEPGHRSYGKLFSILAALIGALIVIGIIAYLFIGRAPAVSTPVTAETIRLGTAPRPPITPDQTIAALSKTSKGFSALISYTDTGFEPARLTIKAGDTVRFTNNSSGSAHVITNGAERDIAQQQYWEVTFNEVGEWTYADQGMMHKGVMVVR